MNFEQAPPRRERILYTHFNSHVMIYRPSANCMRWMGLGGRWGDRERGYVDTQIERQIADGIDEWTAVRFARAMSLGSITDSEALAILRDRDCSRFGTACELLDVSEVPTDRWFRDAWRRSHNGGPIYTAMPIARKIQLKKLTQLAKDRKLELRMERWRQRIRKAKTPEELKAIWPDLAR